MVAGQRGLHCGADRKRWRSEMMWLLAPAVPGRRNGIQPRGRTRSTSSAARPRACCARAGNPASVSSAIEERSQVTSMAVVVATGITANGDGEILGCDVGDSEEEAFWRGFLRSPKARGLGGVQLVISDQHAGLVAALRRSFQGASHQRCRAHFARNLLALVPRSHTDMVAAVFRTIFAQPDADAVSATWDQVRD
jgi:mutator family transposase